ncbi:MAG: 16S rRNA (guanine(527)-N(7))-methyltransferase RsmG [Thermodesulfobacteriota bacterium]
MNEKQFYSALAAGVDQFGVNLSQPALSRLFTYYTELSRWSKKVNLISRSSSELEIVEKHFIDSLTLLPLLTEKSRLLDIGTGAGFPGLVCKAARTDLGLVMVEPRLKRVSFLRHIVRQLKLDEALVLAGRVEEKGLLDPFQQFSHITSRAVTEIGPFLTMCRPLAGKTSRIICMKGPRWEEELGRVDRKMLDSYKMEVMQFVLPLSGAERTLLIFSTPAIAG